MSGLLEDSAKAKTIASMSPIDEAHEYVVQELEILGGSLKRLDARTESVRVLQPTAPNNDPTKDGPAHSDKHEKMIKIGNTVRIYRQHIDTILDEMEI